MQLEWSIEQLEVFPRHGDVEHAIAVAHWRVRGSEGDVMVERCGATGFNQNNREAWVAFEDVTLDVVIGWIESHVGAEEMAQMKADMQAEIAHRITPRTVIKPLPWSA